ncbi:MAG: ABC transporter substrate-binding protein [Candidatus Binatia bacterium]
MNGLGKIFVLIVGIAAFNLFAFTAPAAIKGFGASLDEVVALAKKEGKVRVCSSDPDEKDVDKFFAAFKRKYPGIMIEYTRCRGAESRERILSELLGGQADYDLVHVSSELIPKYQKAGVLAGPFDWKGIFHIRDAFISPDRYLVGAGSSTDVILYNSKLVPKERIPRDWPDCLGPYWKGKFIVETRANTFTGLYPHWGKEKLLDYARKLAANKPIWARGNTEAMNKVIAGEYPMMCGAYLSSALRALSRDPAAPLGIAVPKEVPVNLFATFGVIKAARYPNAAILLAGYLASDEGQRTYRLVFRESPYDEGGETGKRVKEAKAKILFTGWDFTSEQENEVVRWLLEAWGLPTARK